MLGVLRLPPAGSGGMFGVVESCRLVSVYFMAPKGGSVIIKMGAITLIIFCKDR